MNIYLTILFITTLTGVGGLALGGCLAAAVHSPSDRAVSLLLRFTAGVMLSVVCFDLVGDAMEGGGALPVLCWLAIGFLCTYLLNCWIDRQAHHSHSHGHAHGGHGEDHAHGEDADHAHGGVRLGRDNGAPCACGHHTLHTAGLVLAAAVALHNIPEGMAIAAPMLSGGSRPAGAAGVAALSGLPTILGALLGYSAGAMNPLLLTVSLSFAAGAMLYVIFGELLPEAEHLWQHKLSGVATMLGMLLGMALIFGHSH